MNTGLLVLELLSLPLKRQPQGHNESIRRLIKKSNHYVLHKLNNTMLTLRKNSVAFKH